MKYNIFALFIIFFIHFSCVRKQKDSYYDIASTIENSNLHIIDLDKAERIDTCKLSFFFKSAKCVRLDDDSKAIIGGISKLVAYNGKLYVSDTKDAKSLIVFDDDGKYIMKIGERGRGPGEYVRFDDFTINTDENEIILLDYGRIHIYDLNGKFLKTVQLQQVDGNITTLQYYDSLIYTDIHSYQKKDDDCLLQSVRIVDGQRKNRFLNTNEHNKGWNELLVNNMNYFVPKLDPPHLFRHSFMDTIFAITNIGLIPHLVIRSKEMITEKDLVLPPNTSPMIFLTLLSQKDKIYNIYSYFETPEIIHFRYNIGRKVYSVFYNKSKKTTQVASSFNNDFVYKGRKSITTRFIFFNHKGAYEYISYTVLDYLLPLIRDNQLKQPFNDQLKNLNEESNPIIFYYEFK